MKKKIKKNNFNVKKLNKNKNKEKKIHKEKNNKNHNENHNKNKNNNNKNNNNNENNNNENNNNNNKYINNTCFICFNEMDKNNRIILRCNHCLCKFCYKSWAKIKDTCPMCRQLVITKPSEDPCFEDIVRDMYNIRSYIFQKNY